MCRVFAALLVLGLVGSSVAVAQAPSEATDALRYEFEAGASVRTRETLTQEMTMAVMTGQEVKTSMVQEMEVERSVVSVAEDGGASLTSKTVWLKMTAKTPMGDEEYDSRDPDSSPGMATRASAALVGKDLGLVITARGVLSEITGLEVLREVFASTPGVDADAMTDMMKTTMQQAFPQFPEGAVKVGDEWKQEIRTPLPKIGDMVMEMTYTYGGTREVAGRKCIHLDSKIDGRIEAQEGSSMSATMEIDRGEGSTDLDSAIGLPIAGESHLEMTMKLERGGQSMTQHMVTEQKSELVVD